MALPLHELVDDRRLVSTGVEREVVEAAEPELSDWPSAENVKFNGEVVARVIGSEIDFWEKVLGI
jgi:hypothetical protein